MGNDHDPTEDLLHDAAAVHAARVEVDPYARAVCQALAGDLLDPDVAKTAAKRYSELQRVLDSPEVARARCGLDDLRAAVAQEVPA